MNFVLMAKESDGIEKTVYNITSVSENNIEELYDKAKAMLEASRENELKVTVLLEVYNDEGDMVEFSRYNEHDDEFVVIAVYG